MITDIERYERATDIVREVPTALVELPAADLREMIIVYKRAGIMLRNEAMCVVNQYMQNQPKKSG